MKIMTNIKTLAALLMAGAAFTACSSSDEIIEQPANPTAPKVYTMVIKASKGGDATTRALSLNGKTLNACWSGTETIEVEQGGVNIGYATAAASPNGETTLTATLSPAPDPTKDLNFYLGGQDVDFTGQVGLLTGTEGNSISEKYDYANDNVGANSYTVDNVNNTVNQKAGSSIPLEFNAAQQAIIKFTLKNSDGSALPSNPTAFTVTDGDETVELTSIPASTYIANGDGVLYVAFPASGSAKTITLTATVGSDTYTYTKSAVTFALRQYYEITVKMTKQAAAPTGALTGQFTISNDNGTTTRQVVFSQGNLQAVFAEAGSTCTWRFADNQYDYIGNNAANTSINGNGSVSPAGTVDMFGWVGASSSWTGAAMYGVSNSSSGYGNTNDNNLKSDWGNTMGDGWFTLKKDEWNYLITGRTDANQKFGFGKVGGVNGMILLPDSWTLPDGLSFTSGSGGDAWKNSYTTEQWSQMEDAGAVFLPAAGFRNPGSSVDNTGVVGEYWTSTPRTGHWYFSAYYQKFDSNSHSQVGADCSTGCSVRLVRLAE